jgi:CelD/BcsL family acetyltransferase involved in cellulose biosynthesis
MPRAIAALNTHDDTLLAAPRPRADEKAAPARALLDLAVHETLAAVEGEWRAFECTADCTVFQTFEWLDAWQRHVGTRNDVRPAIVVGRASDGGVLFILPLATRPMPFGRELVFLGTELCDYNGPLLAAGFTAAVPDVAALWRRIGAVLNDHPRLRYDVVHLEKMPASIGGQPNPLLALGVTDNPSGAYATALGETWDAFYAAKRSSSTRSRDRGKRKKLAEHGAVAFVEPQAADDVLATIDALVEQKSRSFARMGVSNIFARPGYLDFYRALFTDAKSHGLTHLSRLDCGAQPVAVNLGLTFRGTYYHLQASHTDGDASRFGPGAAHLHDLLRTAIERGFARYDFTIGDEPYKRDWCDAVIPLYDHYAAASARGALLCAPLAAKARLKRLIKQNPALWDAFRHIRSLAGRLMPRR